jgi:hypothetical protein
VRDNPVMSSTREKRFMVPFEISVGCQQLAASIQQRVVRPLHEYGQWQSDGKALIKLSIFPSAAKSRDDFAIRTASAGTGCLKTPLLCSGRVGLQASVQDSLYIDPSRLQPAA